MSAAPRIGIILSSGGIRGVYAHTGFMRALNEMGLQYDAIAGCSAGAIVGGILASGTALDDWERSLRDMTQNDFWKPDSIIRFLRSHLLKSGRDYMGLSSTEPALRFTRNNLSTDTFEHCPTPFYSLAVNLGSGDKTLFSEGKLAERIVASAAVPVLYEPIKIDGQYYCDGALIDFAPTDAICCRHDLDIVIVHHVAQNDTVHGDIDRLKHQPWTLLEIINRLLFRQRPWYLNDHTLNLQHCPCDCGATIIAVEPELPDFIWPSLSGGDRVQSYARSQAIDQLHVYANILKSGDNSQIQTLMNTAFIKHNTHRKNCATA